MKFPVMYQLTILQFLYINRMVMVHQQITSQKVINLENIHKIIQFNTFQHQNNNFMHLKVNKLLPDF